MEIKERVSKLRALMERNGIDIYMVPTADFHNSEYVGEHFKARAFMSGFTGSAGTLIVTKDFAGLWTDGRYFLQGEKQLEGTGIELQKMREPGVPTIAEFVVENTPENGVLGFDGRVVTFGEGKDLATKLKRKNATVKYDVDLVDEVWENRPALSEEPAFYMSLERAGESVSSKLERVRKEMHEVGANIHVITTLDDIGWLLNIRGMDVDYVPVLLSYAVVYEDSVDLYVDERKLSDEIKKHLADHNVHIKPYNDIYEEVKQFSGNDVVLVDPECLNYAVFNNIPKEITLVERRNPTILMKAIKNEVELQHTIKAHVKDGIAHTKFIYWLKQLVKQGTSEQEDELSASAKLVEFRKEQGGFICPSFSPICGHGENGAIVHYSSSKETSIPLRTGTFFLTDTGAHFEEGSTDITRTTAMGEVSDKLKYDYTRVLQCHLRLSRLKFMEGVSGANVDLFARAPLWQDYENFNHGTGHGVGYLGNIHEGPHGIHWGIYRAAEPFKHGMVVTNEPGLYISGSHGIRLENELIVRKTVKNEYGQFMEFEVMTFVPWDLEAINLDMLTIEDKYELNKYHAKVFEVLAPHFEGDELEWLKQATREV